MISKISAISFNHSFTEQKAKTTKKATPAKRTPAKKAIKISEDDDDDFDMSEPVKKKAAPAKRAPSKKAAKAIKDEDEDSDAFQPEQPTTPKKRAANGTAKKTTAAKKTMVAKTNGEAASEDVEMEEPTKTSTKNKIVDYEKKTIEEIYQKKTQLEHILLRPDTYVGSIEAEEQEMWIFDNEESIIKKKKIKYVPGLYKIVDEILVNAADNKVKTTNLFYSIKMVKQKKNCRSEILQCLTSK